MKIALITDGIWPYVMGGMQKHSYYLCKYFAMNKINVDLFHFNQSKLDLTKLEVFSQEEKKYINSIVVPFPSAGRLPGHYIRESKAYSKKVFEKLAPLLKEYDFIYTKGFSGWHLIEQKYSGKVKCCPIGVKFHGYEMFQKPPDLKARLEQYLFLRGPVTEISRKADYVFSYGGKITDIIKSIGVAPEKIIEVPSGVEASILVPSVKQTGSRIKFLYLGRYERRKGIEELNLVLSQLSGDFEFHFIGPIPEEKKIKGPNFIYHNEVRDKVLLNDLIRNCDVLVCPSWSEGLPNVILEAMANGLAVLATDVGATRILVNGKTGWLISDPKPVTLKTEIEKVLSATTKEIDAKKASGLDHMKQNFTWEKLSVELIKKIKAFIP